MAVREKNRSKQAEVRQYSQVQVRFLLGSFQLCSRVFFPRVLVSSKGQPQTKEGGTWRDWVTRVLLGGSSDFTKASWPKGVCEAAGKHLAATAPWITGLAKGCASVLLRMKHGAP